MTSQDMELSNFELSAFLRQYAPHTFYKVCAYNEFKATDCPFFPIAIVANSKPDSVPMGHWVGLFINDQKMGIFFDSFGLEPWGKFANFFRRNASYAVYNTVTLQADETSCGYHVLYFLTQISRRSLWGILKCYERHSDNDRMVVDFYKQRVSVLKPKKIAYHIW